MLTPKIESRKSLFLAEITLKIMDQYLPPSERKSNNYLWLLPILLALVLIFGKKENP